MLQPTSGRLLSFPLFALGLLLGGAACAQDDTRPGWKLSGFGTIGAVHSSERNADYTSNVLKADGARATELVVIVPARNPVSALRPVLMLR